MQGSTGLFTAAVLCIGAVQVASADVGKVADVTTDDVLIGVIVARLLYGSATRDSSRRQADDLRTRTICVSHQPEARTEPCKGAVQVQCEFVGT